MKKNKILFICKRRHNYGPTSYTTVSSGLLNSAKFVNDMLNQNGIESEIVDVVDNNCIDREVNKHKPTHVIIEALWVVPEKFEVLQKLHPEVKWIVRLHSELPFIANEGIAIDWIYKYQNYKNVFISVNSQRMEQELNAILSNQVLYLPNFYPVTFFNKTKCSNEESDTINIGCFGSIRPLKNHLIQAVAAIEFANENNKTLKFHINSSRIENNGSQVLKNIRNLFLNNPKHELIEHEWLSHDEFTALIKQMDLCMQVSLSETFNIVAADAVNNNVPVIVSDEIQWANFMFKCDPNSSLSILANLNFAWFVKNFGLHFLNKISLANYSRKSKNIWIKNFNPFFDCEI